MSLFILSLKIFPTCATNYYTAEIFSKMYVCFPENLYYIYMNVNVMEWRIGMMRNILLEKQLFLFLFYYC